MMIRDVFYYGNKPNVHPREQHAHSLDDAREKSTTEHFWIINENTDYTNFDWDFDFEFLPDEDVWTKDYNNAWPSLTNQDSGTWLCPKEPVDTTIYRQDVKPLRVIYNYWKIYQLIDTDKFDLSWQPDPYDPPYIYVWGNKDTPAEEKPTLEYHVPGAKDKKYMGIVDILPDPIEWDRWKQYDVVQNFDFNWKPDPYDPPYIYVWGNKDTPAQVSPTLEYYTPGAKDKKYMGIVELGVQKDRWKSYDVVQNFDFTWRPDPYDPPYIYVWGNKDTPAEEKPTLEYYTPGAKDKKYMGVVELGVQKDRWKQYDVVDATKFDLTWRPDPYDPPYIYVWGNKYTPAEEKPTLEYYTPGATDRKYMGIVELAPQFDRWVKHDVIDENFDFSWRPDPNLHEPPYIYVWGNKYTPAEVSATLEYHVPGATERKYMGNVELGTDYSRWNILIPIDKTQFDFTWRPDPNLHEPPFVYVFGNKWNDSGTEPTVEYIVPGATVRKYMDNLVATTLADMQYWTITNPDDNDTFDFSWRPNPHSPAQIYQWNENGPRYTVPGATTVVLMERTENNKRKPISKYQIETTLEDLIEKHSNEVFWALNPDLNYDKFDFTWKPNDQNFMHINVFGNEQTKNTQTYYINGPLYRLGHREYNYIQEQQVEIESNLDMFFIDRGNRGSLEQYETLKLQYPNLQKTRYLNTWVDTITRCCKKSKTKLFWVLTSEVDYTRFSFDFYPSPWQYNMLHVFGTQWTHWGNTYLANRDTFEEHTKYVKTVEHLNIINFVKIKRTRAIDCLYDVILIDHGNSETSAVQTLLESRTKQNVTVVKYNSSYNETLKDIAKLLPEYREQYVWITSSVCDYAKFDFTYICDPYAREQLHVFPSNLQKYGDTFFANVTKLREDTDPSINFNQHQRLTRLAAPKFVLDSDSQTDSTLVEYDFPYAIFVTADNKDITNEDNEPISLWDNESKNILVTTTGASRIIVPREAKQHVKKEMYDYPYIKTQSRLTRSRPLDIIFLSNGETVSDDNYKHLLSIAKDKSNRIIRVDGVNGRVASQHAAANASKTNWYFLVNGKLRVNEKFDFNWQPDRLQIAKHYIFLATNPVNKLEYGHQAIVANNKILTLNTVVTGLDFTLDSEHEVVNINSGIGMYNTSVWDTWRTSFRETIKLSNVTDDESSNRLTAWLTIGEGEFGKYSIQGAQDAANYYKSVDGDFDKLMLSYDWEWLKDYYNRLYQK